jgi:hypothetical protein
VEVELTPSEERLLEARAIGRMGLSPEQHYWLFQSTAWAWTVPEIIEVQATLNEVGFRQVPIMIGGMAVDDG